MKSLKKVTTCLFIVFTLSSFTIAGTIISVDPVTAQSGQTLAMGIWGQDTFFDDAPTMSIWLAQPTSEAIYATSYYPLDNAAMAAWFEIPEGAEAGFYDLFVWDDFDGMMVLSSAIKVDQATLSVNPNIAQAGQKLKVLLTGQDTHFVTGSGTTVTFYYQGSPTTQGSATTSWFLNDLLALVEIKVPDDEPIGSRDIGFQNSIDGEVMLYNAITIEPKEPKITSVTPGGAYQGQKLSVALSGQNTFFGSGSFTAGSPTTTFIAGSPTTSTVVWFTKDSQSIYSKESFVHDPQYLTATVDIPFDAVSGLWDVHVPDMKEGTVLTYPDGFNILQPGDWTGDGAVNMIDLGIVASHWLEGTQ